MDFKSYAEKRLRESGYKLTEPRRLVLQALTEAETALNAYEIAKLIPKQIDVSTIYRILKVYEDLKLIHFNRGEQGYFACSDFSCRDADHCHHHFSCKNCDAVQELHLEDGDFLKKMAERFAGLKIEDHYFEFSGLCKNCNNQLS